jgi:hypothetical protein
MSEPAADSPLVDELHTYDREILLSDSSGNPIPSSSA